MERWRGRGEGREAILYLGHFVLRAIFVIRALLVLRGNFAGNVYPEKTLKVIENIYYFFMVFF